MTNLGFSYRAVQREDGSGEVTSLIAYQVPREAPIRAIIWSAPRRAWIYAPGLAVRFLFDDQYQERSRIVDRTTAEELAANVLSTELPSEMKLQEIADEGQRLGQNYGPPRP